MKKDIHPTNYRPVVFQDLNNSQTFLIRSTAVTDETITLDGFEYPLVKVHISSASHPFFTGEERIMDIEGRVDKFKARAAAGQAARQKRASAASKQNQRKIDRIKESEAAKEASDLSNVVK
jgi:large subunit ribosomal protein L31